MGSDYQMEKRKTMSRGERRGESGPTLTLTWDYEDRMTGAVSTNLELTYTATFDPEHKRNWGTGSRATRSRYCCCISSICSLAAATARGQGPVDVVKEFGSSTY